MTDEINLKEGTATEPITPSLSGLTPPGGSSMSTPATAVPDQGSKFKLFDKTPLDRSTSALVQNVATAPPFLRSQEDSITALPVDLVNINLALGALDLDFGSQKKTEKDANVSSSTIADTDDGNVTSKGPTAPGFHGDDRMHQPHLFGPGILPQHLQFFPMNEFGQPLHAPFSTEQMNGGQSPIPWANKAGQPPFGPIMGSPSTNMEIMSHGGPMPNPGMIPMTPFDFHAEGISGHPMHQGHPMHPHDPSAFGPSAFGGDMKDHPFNPNFPPPPSGIENVPFSGPQQHLKNNQMWPQLNNRQGANDGQGFQGGNMPHTNGMNRNNGHSDRRYPYYQNRNNNNNNNNNNHHPHNHNHNGNRRMGGNRGRGEDASRFDNAKLDDFIGQIYSLCKDQHGCRFLQRQLDLDAANATPIFEETQMHVELMIDPFGNYLIQKLLEKVNDEERITLVKNASPEFVAIALDPHGTRALQKLVELINSDTEAKLIVEALSNDVVQLSRDLNGNHVIQRCLNRLKSKDSQFIFDTAVEHCLEIATHRHGCCVLQRCFDHGSEAQCKKLSEIVCKHTVELSLDAYGNYVVQYILARDDEKCIEQVINAIKANFVTLCLHKFGSNVIEKCFKSTSHASELIDELLKDDAELIKFLNDQFGNYVIQTALNVAKPNQAERLSEALKPLLPQMRNTPHGRRILNRLQPNAKPHFHNNRSGHVPPVTIA